ncbi:hypothetical protein DQ04_00851110 [Trypanosoma grayi]|uniref:hypothetical protein n=1 Tax=Trypanosoma grayi TaxID=71804 RepID=UPI0004F479B8|nr:hypothetical protein DQ04_00851110 [Trypanosoma grayi]KEG13685.1 hypothetical protein DQ04_00851110 [Trypanosoma grayi]
MSVLFKRITPPRVRFSEYCIKGDVHELADYIVCLLLTELPGNPCGAVAEALDRCQWEGRNASQLKELRMAYDAYRRFRQRDTMGRASLSTLSPSVVDYVQYHGIAMLLEEWLLHLEEQQPVDALASSRLFFFGEAQSCAGESHTQANVSEAIPQ